MKKVIKHLVLAVSVFIAATANSQIINVNPDPNGEPWIAGDAIPAPPEIEALTPIMT